MRAEDAFNAQLLAALRSAEFRSACVQRFVAATIEPADGLRVVELAIDRVREETCGKVANLQSRLLRAIDAGCADYAAIRGHPYRKLIGPVIRSWARLMSMASQAGLSEEEGYACIRDLLRKAGPLWSRVRGKDVERELLEELRWAFSVLGLTQGLGNLVARR
jgi:hypothetical protein